eukprot:5734873-Ditylum_brightwellii.AAC.1
MKMKILIWLGILPRRFKKLFHGNCVPICASCMFGEAHCKAWQTKGKQGQVCNTNETFPGDGTSTDQLVSGQPGLVPQISEFISGRNLGIQER